MHPDTRGKVWHISTDLKHQSLELCCHCDTRQHWYGSLLLKFESRARFGIVDPKLFGDLGDALVWICID